MTLYRMTIDSPVGHLILVATESALRSVSWAHEVDLARVPLRDDDVIDQEAGFETPVLAEARRQLDEYFAGDRRDFDLPLDPQGSDFQQAVWMELRKIPYGQTISYGEQARRLGDPNKARAVGAANGRNPLGIIVPCHRVVGANGSLTGFAGGLDGKAKLLDLERGVTPLL